MVMFTDFAFSTTQSDHRRRALLAEAEQHRLGEVARAGQRAARRATDLALLRLVSGRGAERAAGPASTAPLGADCSARTS
jgi:hypothetical protein